MKFQNILEILENELELRKIRAKEFWHEHSKLEKEVKKLKEENEILRKDLFELSQEYFNNKHK
jgi:predicted glycosyltransferase involved in capsule biosynthesis